MDLEEYKKKVKSIEAECKQLKQLLDIEYASKNNTVVIGDIVIDHYQRIKVDKISYINNAFTGTPTCIYHGYIVKKDGGRFKSGKRSGSHQSHIKEIIKAPN